MKKLLTLILFMIPFALTSVNAQLTEAEFIYSIAFDQTVRKVDSSGNQVWSYTLGYFGLSVDVDRDGNVYATSKDFSGTAVLTAIDSNANLLWQVEYFNDVIGEFTDIFVSENYIYASNNRGSIFKYDFDGNELQVVDLNIPLIYAIHVDENENLYLTDSGNSIRKYNNQFNLQWSDILGNNPNDIVVDQNGFVYVASSDDRIRKYDNNGNLIFSQVISSRQKSIDVDIDGNIYTGAQNGNVYKRDSNGGQIWTEALGNEVGTVKVDDLLKVYATEENRFVKLRDNGSLEWQFTGHESSINDLALHKPFVEPDTYTVNLNTNYKPYSDFIYSDNDQTIITDQLSTVIDNDESFNITTTPISSQFEFNFWFDLDNNVVFSNESNIEILDPSRNYNLVANYSLNNAISLSFDSTLPSPPNFVLTTSSIQNQTVNITNNLFNNFQHPFDFDYEIMAPTNNIGFYEFDYWYDNVNNEVYSLNPLITSSGIESLNLTATYSLPEEYQINLTLESNVGPITFQHGTFDPITGTFISVTIAEGDVWSATAPTNPDFQFYEWADLDTSEVFSTDINIQVSNTTRNYNLRPLYFDLVNVYWDSNGGTPIPNQKVILGSIINPPNDPVRPNFVFDGWENSIGQKQQFPTTILEDVTFTAIWLDTYTLTFDTNGGGRIDTQTYIDGSIPEVVTPSRFGYTFEGWFTDDGTFQNAYDFTNPITQDTTIHAKWAFGSDRDAELSLTTFLNDNDLGDPFSRIIVMITIYVFVNIVIMIYQAPLVVSLILNFIVTSLFMILGWIAIWLVVVIFMALFGFLYFTSSGRGLTE